MRAELPAFAVSASLVVVSLLVAGCAEEESTPIDFDATTTSSRPTVSPPADDPNAGARNQVIEFAEEQCRADPDLETGVVVFADPETGEELSRFELPCDEVRP